MTAANLTGVTFCPFFVPVLKPFDMIRKPLSFFALFLACCMAVASCGTSRNSTRKCDGRKGQKTSMGRI
jgi:hypothetical protein